MGVDAVVVEGVHRPDGVKGDGGGSGGQRQGQDIVFMERGETEDSWARSLVENTSRIFNQLGI